jgi:hypothetical protein
LKRSTIPTTDAVEIQQQVGLAISFVMPVPVEKSSNGCYMKLQFPKDFSLPDPSNEDLALVYQTLPNSMMSNSKGGANLDSGKQVDATN